MALLIGNMSLEACNRESFLVNNHFPLCKSFPTCHVLYTIATYLKLLIMLHVYTSLLYCLLSNVHY